jgi:hypothetical protein
LRLRRILDAQHLYLYSARMRQWAT